jgi:II/X family phage/plasmid replication protein
MIYVSHPFRKENIKISITRDRQNLMLCESLPKMLQGHNVFGSNDLHGLCLATTALIYVALEIPFSADEQGQIDQYSGGKGFVLNRVDPAGSFRAKSQVMVSEGLNEIAEHFKALGRAWSAYGYNDVTETVYAQQRSRRVTAKFYNKYRELLVNQISIDVPLRDRLINFARQVVRFEMTYRQQELKRLGLSHSKDWNRDVVINLLMDRIEGFGFSADLKKRLDMEVVNGLNPACKFFYRLWHDGADLRSGRSYLPLARARRVLQQHGVDIFRAPKTSTKIAISELLSAENACFGSPKVLLEGGAIFVPKRKHITRQHLLRQ